MHALILYIYELPCQRSAVVAERPRDAYVVESFAKLLKIVRNHTVEYGECQLRDTVLPSSKIARRSVATAPRYLSYRTKKR